MYSSDAEIAVTNIFWPFHANVAVSARPAIRKQYSAPAALVDIVNKKFLMLLIFIVSAAADEPAQEASQA